MGGRPRRVGKAGTWGCSVLAAAALMGPVFVQSMQPTMAAAPLGAAGAAGEGM